MNVDPTGGTSADAKWTQVLLAANAQIHDEMMDACKRAYERFEEHMDGIRVKQTAGKGDTGEDDATGFTQAARKRKPSKVAAEQAAKRARVADGVLPPFLCTSTQAASCIEKDVCGVLFAVWLACKRSQFRTG